MLLLLMADLSVNLKIEQQLEGERSTIMTGIAKTNKFYFGQSLYFYTEHHRRRRPERDTFRDMRYPFLGGTLIMLTIAGSE